MEKEVIAAVVEACSGVAAVALEVIFVVLFAPARVVLSVVVDVLLGGWSRASVASCSVVVVVVVRCPSTCAVTHVT